MEDNHKIKLIIFDCDGTLLRTRDMHYVSLNRALERIDKKYTITPRRHSSTYDGRSTSQKLQMLSKLEGLPVEVHNEVWRMKQEETINEIDKMCYDERMRTILRTLKERGYTLYCASNSIWKTLTRMLLRTGLIEYFDYLTGNDELKTPKPSCEIYLRCILRAGLSPKECLILEDSDIGRTSAIASGAHLCDVLDPDDVTLEKIERYIRTAEQKNIEDSQRILGGMNALKVVIPCAGLGSRFAKAGYNMPKPMIDVQGKAMIDVVVRNLNMKAKYIFIVQKVHVEQYDMKHLLEAIAPGCEVVVIDGLTQGAAETVLAAEHLINDGSPMVIANCDQFIEYNSSAFLYRMNSEGIDGGMLTFEDNDPKWSYVKLDEKGFICEIKEKEVISNIATVGIYFWKRGSDFVKYAKQMIERDIRVNNEYYVAPVYALAIDDGLKFRSSSVECMWGNFCLFEVF